MNRMRGVSINYPLETEVEEALLSFLASQEMQLVQQRRILSDTIGIPGIEGLGVEMSFFLPSYSVLMFVELERGSLIMRAGIYEILNPAEALESLLEILGLGDVENPLCCYDVASKDGWSRPHVFDAE